VKRICLFVFFFFLFLCATNWNIKNTFALQGNTKPCVTSNECTSQCCALNPDEQQRQITQYTCQEKASGVQCKASGDTSSGDNAGQGNTINKGQDQTSCHHADEPCTYGGNECCTSESLSCVHDAMTTTWFCADASKFPEGSGYSTTPGDDWSYDVPTVDPGKPPCAQDALDATQGCTKLDTGFGVPIATDQTGFIRDVFGIILSISGGIALLLIILSGYRLMTSGGQAEKVKGSREQLVSAIIGLLFIIFSLVILQIIGVDILKIPGFT
jgi:hypothetical protein